MKVDCDECVKEFELELKEIDAGKGVKRRFFDCPHCKYRYEVLVHKSPK